MLCGGGYIPCILGISWMTDFTECLMGHDLGKPDNRIQRCPKLMAHIREEDRFCGIGFRRLLNCSIAFALRFLDRRNVGANAAISTERTGFIKDRDTADAPPRFRPFSIDDDVVKVAERQVFK